MRFVRLFPMPLDDRQAQVLIDISDALRIDDYELLYLCTVAAVDMVLAAAAYMLMMRIWRAALRGMKRRS